MASMCTTAAGGLRLKPKSNFFSTRLLDLDLIGGQQARQSFQGELGLFDLIGIGIEAIIHRRRKIGFFQYRAIKQIVDRIYKST
jgi:hypothetical protein